MRGVLCDGVLCRIQPGQGQLKPVPAVAGCQQEVSCPQHKVGRVRQRVRRRSEGVSSCVKSIINCCDTASPRDSLPLRCFEVNGCPGLYWSKLDCTSTGLVAQILSAMQP